ncbi:MAG: hypothetical protein JO356_07520 [Acidobacteria bacterium]|nr:hypothetical protein [Acidobacteriota bacterium]
MGSYLQQYGAGEEKRNRVLKVTVLALIGVVVIALAAYWILKDYPEERRAKQFLGEVNAHNYQAAYQDWGCTAQHPCPNYDYKRFVDDWTGAGKKANGPWRIESKDSCRSFLTVNVRADGTDLQSLAVQRSDKSLSFAPDSECQEAKWRWKQFFDRILGRTPPPTKRAS